MINLLCACSRCGRIHEKGNCPLGDNKRVDRRTKTRTDIVKFRSSAEWQHKRDLIVKRDNYLCRLCLHNKLINNHNLEVHHIVPIHSNDELKLEDNNLITLCHSCHKLVENDKVFRQLLLVLASTPPYKEI